MIYCDYKNDPFSTMAPGAAKRGEITLFRANEFLGGSRSKKK